MLSVSVRRDYTCMSSSSVIMQSPDKANPQSSMSVLCFIFYIISEEGTTSVNFVFFLIPCSYLLCFQMFRSESSESIFLNNQKSSNLSCLVLQEVNFNMLDTTETGLLKSVEQLLSEIFIPAMRKMDHGWGELANPQTLTVRQDFLSSLDNFVAVLSGAQESLMEKVIFKSPQ